MTTKLKRERLACPKCRGKLWFKQIHEMRVIEDGKLNAMCPKCNEYYSMPSK